MRAVPAAPALRPVAGVELAGRLARRGGPAPVWDRRGFAATRLLGAACGQNSGSVGGGAPDSGVAVGARG
jgi:hypothetical protein